MAVITKRKNQISGNAGKGKRGPKYQEHQFVLQRIFIHAHIIIFGLSILRFQKKRCTIKVIRFLPVSDFYRKKGTD